MVMGSERAAVNFGSLGQRDETRGLNITQAVEALRAGQYVRFEEWGPNDPSCLVLVPGREVPVSFPPMSDLLGEGAKFDSVDHIDAVYMVIVGEEVIATRVVLGYHFSQREILHSGWIIT